MDKSSGSQREPPEGLPKTRVCRTCRKRKRLRAFSHRWTIDSRNGNQFYKIETECRPCVVLRVARWQEQNPLRTAANKRKWYDSNMDYWAELRKDAAWLASRKDWEAEHYERNHEKRKAQAQAWAKANPERTQFFNERRRASLQSSEVSLTFAQWQNMLARYATSCMVCGQSPPSSLSLDHLIPLSRGGSHTRRNCRPMCRSCNSSKRASALTEWLPRRAKFLARRGVNVDVDAIIKRLRRERASFE